MPRTIHQGIVREFHIVWRVVTLQNERVYANGDANRVDT